MRIRNVEYAKISPSFRAPGAVIKACRPISIWYIAYA